MKERKVVHKPSTIIIVLRTKNVTPRLPVLKKLNKTKRHKIDKTVFSPLFNIAQRVGRPKTKISYNRKMFLSTSNYY